MTIDRADFEDINEHDLQQLVDSKTPESVYLEFKQELYKGGDADKKEALKDISAIANSHGGHLIIGISDEEGSASEIVGIDADNPDGQVRRLEEIALNGIEPRIHGIRIRHIPLSNGKYVIIARIPKSWNPPHRVIFSKSNRFYIRHTASAQEASVEELRALFTMSSTAINYAKTFREKRLSTIQNLEESNPLSGLGQIILHIYPLSAATLIDQVDLKLAYSKEKCFAPMGASGLLPKYNFDGVRFERGGDKNRGYTQIFRNGVIESTKAELIGQGRARDNVVNAVHTEDHFIDAYNRHLTGLMEIGVSTPIIVMITLTGMLGARYILPNSYGDEAEFDRDILRLPECLLEDYGSDTDHQRAIKPAFDSLWNGVGYAESPLFDENGAWIGGAKFR